MSNVIDAPPLSHLVLAISAAFERRRTVGRALIDQSDAIARASLGIARRFHDGGKLIAFGNGGKSTDVQPIAVEFINPVIVGKPALPTMLLTTDSATLTGLSNRRVWNDVFAHQLQDVASARDIALGISTDGCCQNVWRGLECAKEQGLLTVALTGATSGSWAHNAALDHSLIVRSEDPQIVKDMLVTMYHLLWELVHVFFEQPSVLASKDRQ